MIYVLKATAVVIWLLAAITARSSHTLWRESHRTVGQRHVDLQTGALWGGLFTMAFFTVSAALWHR